MSITVHERTPAIIQWKFPGRCATALIFRPRWHFSFDFFSVRLVLAGSRRNFPLQFFLILFALFARARRNFALQFVFVLWLIFAWAWWRFSLEWSVALVAVNGQLTTRSFLSNFVRSTFIHGISIWLTSFPLSLNLLLVSVLKSCCKKFYG